MYANPTDGDVGDDKFGVAWRRWYEIDVEIAPDAFVAWRNPEAAALLPRAKRRCVTRLAASAQTDDAITMRCPRDYDVITM